MGGYIAGMKLNIVFTLFALAASSLLTQACLPLFTGDEGDRTIEEIFSFRNETGKDVRTCVYFYEKNFTPQERRLIDLQMEIERLEGLLKSGGENGGGVSEKLKKAREEYSALYAKVNSAEFDKELYGDGGEKVQIYTAREMLQDSIIRFVTDERFIDNVGDRANIYMFGANLAVAHDGKLYLYDLEPLYTNLSRYGKDTYELTPTLPAFFPFHYNWHYYRVNIRKDGKMPDEYRLKRLIVANFMPAYNFGVGKREMPRNGTLRYQLVLLDDMKLYVREIESGINEYWGSREDFVAKFKDRQDEYRGFPISPSRVIDAAELEKIREIKTGDDFSWALAEPERKPLPESRKTFDDTMYRIMVDAIKGGKKK